MSMKKVLATAAIGLVAVAGISSYQGHQLAQQSFDTQVELLRKLAPGYRLSLTDAELTQGLFGGDVRIALLFDAADAQIPSLTLLLTSTLQYGPLLLTDSGIKLGLVAGKSQLAVRGLSVTNAEKLEALIGPHLLTADHWVDFSNQLVATIDAPGVDIQEDAQQFSFDGIRAEIHSDLDSRQLTADLALGSFSVSSPEGTLAIDSGRALLESADISSYVAPGSLKLNLPQIDFNQPGVAISLKEVSLGLRQTLDNGMLSATETLKVAEIISPLPISAANVSFTFNQINPKGIELWGEVVGQLDADGSMPEITPEEGRALISALLQPGLEFIQSYQLSTAQGSLDANLSIEYRGLAAGLHPMDVEDPRQFLQAFKAELDISADQQAIMALPVAGMVAAYIEQGFLVQDQQTLRLDAKLLDGELSLNGKSFPLDSWL
ncbi:MAG: hypothetical protein ACJAWL_001838 [Motiliproteus sp.]|jgi:hypothetical protein